MLIQQLASSQAEAVFIVGQNVSNVTLSGNTLVCFESYGTLASSVSYGNAAVLEKLYENIERDSLAGVVHAMENGYLRLIIFDGRAMKVHLEALDILRWRGDDLMAGRLGIGVIYALHGGGFHAELFATDEGANHPTESAARAALERAATEALTGEP